MALPALIEVSDFFADAMFAGATISPDGRRLAYLAPKYGRKQVWVRGIDEGHDQAVCVTHDARRGINAYTWTDDPRWLLYLQDTDGNEDWHLHRVDLDAPEQPAVDLTPMAPGSRVMGVERMHSHPGSVRVMMNRRPMFIDAFRIDVATGETILIREAPEVTGAFIFGRNDEAFYTKQSSDGLWEYYAVDGRTGEMRLFRRQGGPEHPVGVNPALVAPDGRGLLVGAYLDSDDLSLVRIDAETGAASVVAALPGHSLEASAPLLTRKRTGEILAVRFVGDRPIVQALDPNFAEVLAALAKLSDGVLAAVSSDDSEQKWIATFNHDREPGLTYLYDHGTGESRLLFRPFPHLDPAGLAPMLPVEIAARDGLALHGFLTLPVGVDPKRLPLVLVVHGGPWYADSWGYDREAQCLANRGYAVLQVNFRGSTGYGKRHVTAAIGEFAGKMHTDLIDAADWAVRQGYADPERIGIYGGSYGGYSALVGVAFTPDYFAAAVDYCGISNLANFMRTLPPFVKPYLSTSWYCYVGDPDDPVQEADMLARSPITRVDDIRTPLLVAQGANDVRVVQAEADNIVEALRARRIPVEYLVAEDEGHGFANPENVIALFRAIERHFGKHLGGRVGRQDGAAASLER